METNQLPRGRARATHALSRRLAAAGITLFCLSFAAAAHGYGTNHYASGGRFSRRYELLIDGFEASVARLEAVDQGGTFPVPVAATVEGSMIGGEFDVLFELRGVQSPETRVWLEILGGLLHYHQDPGTTGSVIWHYDGVDLNPTHIVASEGLGGIDLTKGGALDRFAVKVFSNASPIDLSFVVFSDVENGSEITRPIPASEQPGTVWYPYSELIASSGNGADLTAITAILVVIGTGGFTGEVDLSLSCIKATGDPRAPKVLYDQLRDRVDTTIYSLNFPGDNPFDAQAADDFTVPAGKSWRVGGFRLGGVYVPSAPPNPTADITIFADDAGRPGDEWFSATGVPISPTNIPGIWDAFLGETREVPEGRYWVTLQGNVPIGTELRLNENSTLRGEPYHWRNPGGALAPNCTDWNVGTDCLGQQPSLAFGLLGPVPSGTGKAYEDRYDCFGNVGISVPAVRGLLANDALSAGPVVGYDTPTINGASLSVTPDGGFDYTPAPGFVGDDAFTYTRQDGSEATAHLRAAFRLVPQQRSAGRRRLNE
ncbi:MAG: hypothetical protein JW993_21095 [Sedimentisphaerales bacterium]|nr:hypothetical protein [Sedimentisphaerales bacterium]